MITNEEMYVIRQAIRAAKTNKSIRRRKMADGSTAVAWPDHNDSRRIYWRVYGADDKCRDQGVYTTDR
jgi:hypothetical protein